MDWIAPLFIEVSSNGQKNWSWRTVQFLGTPLPPPHTPRVLRDDAPFREIFVLTYLTHLENLFFCFTDSARVPSGSLQRQTQDLQGEQRLFTLFTFTLFIIYIIQHIMGLIMYILTTLEFPNHNHDFHLLTTSVNAKYYY